MITEKELVERLYVLEQAGRYQELLAQADLYLTDNPDLQALYLYKGNALRQLGDLQGALSAYRWAIIYDPNDIEARTNYAATLFDLKDYVGALNAADAAILMKPQEATPYLISGNILSLLGYPEQAMYPYHQAYNFDKQNIALGSYVVELYSTQEEPEEAYTTLMDVLSYAPKNLSLHLQMAVMLVFFMKNGLVKFDRIDEMTALWEKTYSNPFVRAAARAIFAHDMNYSPITSDVLAQAFDAQTPYFEDNSQDDAIRFISLLESSLREVYEGRDDLEVLDIGCGTGLAGYPLREYTQKGGLTGVDLSHDLLHVASQKNLYKKLKQVEATFYIAQEGVQYDVLVARDSLTYFGNLEKAFQAFNQALKPHGKFFFSVKQNTFNNEDILLYPAYCYLFKDSYLRGVFERTGFEILSHEAMQEGSDELVHDKRHFYVLEKKG